MIEVGEAIDLLTIYNQRYLEPQEEGEVARQAGHSYSVSAIATKMHS
jgi:hypothetical protein